MADHTGLNASSGELIGRITEERSGPSTNCSPTAVSPKSAASFSELDPLIDRTFGEECSDFSLEARTPDQVNGPVGPTELGRRSWRSSASAGTGASLSGTCSIQRSVSDGPTLLNLPCAISESVSASIRDGRPFSSVRELLPNP